MSGFDRELEKCELCPRRCGVDRQAGRTGYCRAGAEAEIFRWGPHPGEEPPLSRGSGSGTVFFSRCTLECIYCQNYPWSREGKGTRYDGAGLKKILESLASSGCANWNLVSPTPWLPLICEAIEETRRSGITLPVVYNTSGFERVETLRRVEDIVDIYLPDLRYSIDRSAVEGSGHEYVGIARRAFGEMWRQKGPLRTDEDGTAVSGTICRILILPGRAEEAIDSLNWLASVTGGEAAISLMAQYTPAYLAVDRAPWNRRITAGEYDSVCRAAEELGFRTGWVQGYGLISDKELVGYRMCAVE